MKPWYRAYVGTVSDGKIAEAAMVADVSRCVILATWQAILESASYEERGGAFATTPRRIAATLAEPLATIEAAFAGLAEVGMIAEGTVVAWQKRQRDSDAPGSSTTRVQALRERRRGGSPGRGGPDDAPELPGVGSPSAGSADGDVTACNNPPALHQGDVTISESETDSETDSSSSVVVPFAPRVAAPPGTRDDDEVLIEKVSRSLGGRAEAKVVRSGLGFVRGWLAEGCDLERDVLPELTEIGRRLTRPLATFAAPWLAAQVLARRDGRLGAQKARGAAGPPPDLVFVAVDTPQWEAHVAAGHKTGIRTTTMIDGRRREGWRFASEWPPGHGDVKAAR